MTDTGTTTEDTIDASGPGPSVRMAMVTIDCADPQAEAEFWSALLGWDIAVATEEYAMLTGPGGGAALGFGRVDDHAPPEWPNQSGSKQFHLDLAAEDPKAAEERALELGATLADPQPGESWRVLIDPAGHPFCVTDAANW